jgi:hypothetical protein
MCPLSKQSPHYHVIFRACDVVHSVNKAERPYGLDKPTLIRICFLSLMDALTEVPHTVYVVGDKLSDSIQVFFRQFPTVQLSNGSYGNDASIRKTVELACTLPSEDWVYFCEDDYLHTSNCFAMIDDFLTSTEQAFAYRPRLYNLASLTNLNKKELYIHPPDYPDRYRDKWRRFSYIFHGKHWHWRQITSTTFTFLTKVSTVINRKEILLKSSIGANDHYLSEKLFGRYTFFNKGLCISPMPGLSTHMHDTTMSPVVDWETLVQSLLLRPEMNPANL